MPHFKNCPNGLWPRLIRLISNGCSLLIKLLYFKAGRDPWTMQITHIIKHERWFFFLKRAGGAFSFAWPCPNDLPPFTTNSKTKLKCVRYKTKNITDDGMRYLYISPGGLPSPRISCMVNAFPATNDLSVCVCGVKGNSSKYAGHITSSDHVTQNA